MFAISSMSLTCTAVHSPSTMFRTSSAIFPFYLELWLIIISYSYLSIYIRQPIEDDPNKKKKLFVIGINSLVSIVFSKFSSKSTFQQHPFFRYGICKRSCRKCIEAVKFEKFPFVDRYIITFSISMNNIFVCFILLFISCDESKSLIQQPIYYTYMKVLSYQYRFQLQKLLRSLLMTSHLFSFISNHNPMNILRSATLLLQILQTCGQQRSVKLPNNFVLIKKSSATFS